MYAEKHAVAVVTAADGSFTGYSPDITGRVLSVHVTVPGSGGIEATSDITITAERSGEAILTLTNQNGSGSFYPRSQVHGTTGTALTLDGTRAMVEAPALVKDRAKIVIAQGGNAKSATITFIIG